jgi:integrase
VNTPASVYNYHKRLKVYVREAHFMDIIKENPYNGFRLSKGEQGRSVKYLTEDELAMVESATVNNNSTRNAKACFLFCCFTGLAYADLAKFNWGKDVYRVNEKFFIEDVRTKTGTSYKIQILSKAYNILQECNFSLPVVSNQKYNNALKVLSSCAKLNKPLTSHMARHTFAVFALNNGVRIEVVSKMLAHTDIKTTQIYAKVLQKEVEAGFDLLEEKLNRKNDSK